MEPIKYEFSAEPYCDEWVFVALPTELSAEIRSNFKSLEEGWGRMKVTATLGNSEWQTAIWFDTKQAAYLLPLKAKIRKQERVVLGEAVKITISVYLSLI